MIETLKKQEGLLYRRKAWVNSPGSSNLAFTWSDDQEAFVYIKYLEMPGDVVLLKSKATGNKVGTPLEAEDLEIFLDHIIEGGSIFIVENQLEEMLPKQEAGILYQPWNWNHFPSDESHLCFTWDADRELFRTVKCTEDQDGTLIYDPSQRVAITKEETYTQTSVSIVSNLCWADRWLSSWG